MATALMADVKRATARVTTLKRRPEFLRVRKGARWATTTFVLEAKVREATPSEPAGIARFGFTVTRQVGKAVERNRIRRRLKSAVGAVLGEHAKPEFDYVVIARRPALEAAYGDLVADLAKALARVHRPPAAAKRRKDQDAGATPRSR